ncbi:MAG: hypothetical protein Kow0073_02630 [Immundisolibacter sp.]
MRIDTKHRSATRRLLLALSGAAGLAFTCVSAADELPVGTVIDAANFDAIAASTFEGHTIREMVPPSVEILIKKYNLKLTLASSDDRILSVNEKFWQTSKKNAETINFDPATRQISGYVGGIPFPDISIDDPHAGDKELYNLFWNFTYFGGAARGDFPFLYIDGKKGVERTNLWHQTVLNLSGRATEPHNLPLGEKFGIQKRDALFALEPRDIKGTGTFTQRYTDGRPDDAWVYIRSIRRVRRVSGGSWADAIGGSDVHLDDINGFNAHPTWFKSARLVERKWILHWNFDKPQQNKAGKTLDERFPYLDLTNPPYWNAIQDWRPTRVNVVEIIPEASHPFYSNKILYTMADFPGTPAVLEAYDKKGELWKVETISRGTATDESGDVWFAGFCSYMYDLQQEHATLLVGDEFKVDNRIREDDVTKDILLVQ